jgi:surface polysaccharide O-acyltransferase-like enzyme
VTAGPISSPAPAAQAVAAQAVVATPRRSRPPHVPAADVVRVLTFACVIAVHALATTLPLDDPRADAAAMLLHFTREAFFVLTAFVLVHTNQGRPVRVGPFWRRRFLLVGVPYVVWTVLYTGLQQVPSPLPPADLARSLAINLATGTGWYHLYFLLVSMQFYLLFPLFQRLLAATRRHPGPLLLGALVLQLLADRGIAGLDPTGEAAVLMPSFIGSYVFFLVLGGVVAMHREAVLGAVRRHPVLVGVALLLTGAAAEGSYLLAVRGGTNPMVASGVFQPVMIPWVVAVVAAFALLGMWWGPGGGSPRWVGWASDRSFGVFLVHPVFLWAQTGGWALLTGVPNPYAALPQPLPVVAVYLVAVIASLAVVTALRRTPLRLPLTGKPAPRTTAGKPRDRNR